MLIVSQDKMKTTENMELWIEELWENTQFERKLFYIKNQTGTLGAYETKKRAKEVLQEMINTYKNTDIEAEITGMNRERVAVELSPINTQSKSKSYNFKIYEMPEN